MWLLPVAVILVILLDTATGQCGGGTAYKKMDIPSSHLKGWFRESRVNSIKECGELCEDDPRCRSFGVNITHGKCYQYQFLVYAGGNASSDGLSLLYYWEHKKECPTGYSNVSTANFCYRVFSEKRNFSAAQGRCEEDGGLLAMADTEEKFETLKNAYIPSPTMMYLGAVDFDHEGTWNWFNGIPITNHWDPNQPNNYRGNQHCLTMWKGATLNDLPCDLLRTFACEIPMI